MYVSAVVIHKIGSPTDMPTPRDFSLNSRTHMQALSLHFRGMANPVGLYMYICVQVNLQLHIYTQCRDKIGITRHIMMHQVLYNVRVTLFIGQLHNIDMSCNPNLVSSAIFPI